MKQRLCRFLLFLLLASSTKCMAQAKAGSLVASGGYGLWPANILLHQTIIGGGSHGSHVSHSSGAMQVGCRYYLANNFAIGVGYGYHFLSGYTFDSDPSYNSIFDYTYNTVSIDVAYGYEVDKNVKLYCALAGGLSFVHGHTEKRKVSTDIDIKWPSMQLTPIGVSIGRRLSGFVELGFGYKGFVNGGITYMLRKGGREIVPPDTVE